MGIGVKLVKTKKPGIEYLPEAPPLHVVEPRYTAVAQPSIMRSCSQAAEKHCDFDKMVEYVALRLSRCNAKVL